MESNTLTIISMLLTYTIGICGFVFSLLFLHNQARQERVTSDDRWAKLKTESDERFRQSDERFRQSDERWLAVESKILAIMEQLQMNARGKP